MKIGEVFDYDSLPGKIYFCSDMHYGHENVISFGNRPFSSVEEMDKSILQELKTKLTPDDILFTLGDDFWKMKANSIYWILDNVIPTNKIYKIVGNHDKYGYYIRGGALEKKFKAIGDIMDIGIKKENQLYHVVLCHYPIYDFNMMYHGGIHLFGHVHGSLDDEMSKNPRLMVDVGYDGQLAKRCGSFLISFDEILDYFYEKTGGIDFDTWGRKNYHSTVQDYAYASEV